MTSARKSVVVVVDADAWVHRAVAAAVPAEEIDVVPCTTARGGLNACCAIEPDCVVADIALADLDGLWLARSLREQASAIAATPFVLLSTDDREEAHLAALRGGVDVFVPKPFNVVELVAQIRALIAMASRMRNRRDSVLPGASAADSSSARERAVVGHLDRISIATVLAALELERRSGLLTLSGGAAGRRRMELDVASGALTGGRVGATHLRPIDALRNALHWDGKRFQFVPSEPVAAPAGAESIGSLVLAAIRLDESPADPSVGPADPRRPDLEARSAPALAGAPPLLSGVRAPPRPARPPLPAASGISGTRPRVPPPLPGGATGAIRAGRAAAPAPMSPPPSPAAPGHRLIETMAPAPRPDPRTELDDETTMKIGTRARR